MHRPGAGVFQRRKPDLLKPLPGPFIRVRVVGRFVEFPTCPRTLVPHSAEV